jgi:hypothetical protein
MLVAAGASLSLADKERHTPRSLAERAGDADLAIYLESQLWLHIYKYKLTLHIKNDFFFFKF